MAAAAASSHLGKSGSREKAGSRARLSSRLVSQSPTSSSEAPPPKLPECSQTEPTAWDEVFVVDEPVRRAAAAYNG